MIKPIRPEDLDPLEDWVIEVWNDQIRKSWNGEKAIISIGSMVDRLKTKAKELDKDFCSKTYDSTVIKNVYSPMGWTVDYSERPCDHGYLYFEKSL